MAKPRTFVSSTFFDLADARATLGKFLRGLGHEPLMHEDPEFGVTPGAHSHVACLDQVDLADFLVLIVGGRRGGTYVASEKSITNEEYNRALKRKIPVMIFVKKQIMDALVMYKKNPKGDFSSVVDSNEVFHFVERLHTQSEDNWIHSFNDVQNIVEKLQAQFAYIHLLFSRRHVKEHTPAAKGGTDERRLVSFPNDLSGVTDGVDQDESTSLVAGLRTLHEVIQKMVTEKVRGFDEKLKVLWLFGRYGSLTGMSERLRISEPNFRQRA